MKSLLYTGYNEAYQPLADITFPRMQKWAEKNGIEFTAFYSPDPYDVYWTGVQGADIALQLGYERVRYLDADQLITDMDEPMRLFGGGFNTSKDWGEDAVEPWQFSMCGFVADQSCIALFATALSMKEEWRDRPFPEQGPMQHLVKTGVFKINLHPRRTFNAVPIEVHPSVVEPWQPGDPCAHLTMLPLEERVALAGKILERL